MRGHLQQIRGELVIGWLLALLGTTVYLLTLEPTVSFWDSGEFIAVAYGLQVGHPPGAPLYTLLAHAFTWLAGGNPMLVARCCNALSAVAGGVTLMFMFWSILLTMDVDPGCGRGRPRSQVIPALVGTLCYLFCDTAWFSAVESEVYSLAMLIASIIVWAALRWHRGRDGRWLLLVAFLAGLGTCVHLLTLLALPTVLLLVGIKGLWKRPLAFYLLLCAFFLIGLTPYLLVPIRAAAGTPINEGNPSTAEGFKAYVTRERYEHAPLYPRMWRNHKNDALYASSWSGGDTGLAGNMRYYFSYQLNYMYLRYLMWNFAGRYNDRQGYGSPQNGQFITGIPPLDRLLVGTAARLPDSLPSRGHNRYFLLPLLLGLAGMCALWRKRRMFWTLMTLFLMGGIILSVYLNHPAYEPRERDYAYILSFYAFALFIAHGARWLTASLRKGRTAMAVVLLAIPALMAFQNWDDHDRSNRYIARDAGMNILNSCCHDEKGAVLFAYGDNDTFPLWYLQTVEAARLDVRVENIGLMGWRNFMTLLDESIKADRPVYFTHYAYNQFHNTFPKRLLLEGNAYRLTTEETDDTVAVEAFYRHLAEDMGWQSLEGVYIDETCCKFLEQYWKDVVVLSRNLADHDHPWAALAALDKTQSEIPLTTIQDVQLMYSIAMAYRQAGDEEGCNHVIGYLRNVLQEQLEYYHTQSPTRQRNMPYTLQPREELMKTLQGS